MNLGQAMAVVLSTAFHSGRGGDAFEIKREGTDWTQADDAIPLEVYQKAMDVIRAEAQKVAKG